jgi:hypothetical protein
VNGFIKRTPVGSKWARLRVFMSAMMRAMIADSDTGHYVHIHARRRVSIVGAEVTEFSDLS